MKYEKPTEKDMDETAAIMRSQEGIYAASCLPPVQYKIALATALVINDMGEKPPIFPNPSDHTITALLDQRTPEGKALQTAVARVVKEQNYHQDKPVCSIAGEIYGDMLMQASAQNMTKGLYDPDFRKEHLPEESLRYIDHIRHNPGNHSDNLLRTLQSNANGQYHEHGPERQREVRVSIGIIGHGRAEKYEEKYGSLDYVELNDPNKDMEVKTPLHWAKAARENRITVEGHEVSTPRVASVSQMMTAASQGMNR